MLESYGGGVAVSSYAHISSIDHAPARDLAEYWEEPVAVFLVPGGRCRALPGAAARCRALLRMARLRRCWACGRALHRCRRGVGGGRQGARRPATGQAGVRADTCALACAQAR